MGARANSHKKFENQKSKPQPINKQWIFVKKLFVHYTKSEPQPTRGGWGGGAREHNSSDNDNDDNNDDNNNRNDKQNTTTTTTTTTTTNNVNDNDNDNNNSNTKHIMAYCYFTVELLHVLISTLN